MKLLSDEVWASEGDAGDCGAEASDEVVYEVWKEAGPFAGAVDPIKLDSAALSAGICELSIELGG